MQNANQALRAEAFKRANALFPDPGVGKDVEYRDPGRGGISDSMLMTDPNTGEIFRRGGGRSINQELAMKQPKKEKKMDLRRRAGDALKSFGNKLLDADEAYAGMADRQSLPAYMQMGHAIPLREAVDYAQDPMKLAGKGEDKSIAGRAARGAFNAAVVGSNVASRYALPAGGITLAGKALIDLTAAYGGAADQPEPMTLSM